MGARGGRGGRGVGRRRWPRRLLARGLQGVAVLLLLALTAHFVVVLATTMSPPTVTPPLGTLHRCPGDATCRAFGDAGAYVRMRGRIREVRLVGGPEAIGYAHGRLLTDDFIAIETDLQHTFADRIPLSPLRWLLVDLARIKFAGLDHQIADDARRELAAQALGFSPDPFDGEMTTYQRFVFLHALYDIMLSFEGSPLVGCSSFAVRGSASRAGHVLLARNFDFEGPAILDERKVVFLVRERGRIPYASVSWPGFVGAVSGLNAAGLAIVIHGARALEPRSTGQPVAETVRDLLGAARTTADAVALLAGRESMVPHMLMLADRSGDVRVVERAPGVEPFVRPIEGDSLRLTNHFEGPLADDPKNQRVRQRTSTVPRRERLDELVANAGPPIDVQRAVEILRDRHGAGEVDLPLGHRSAIDALIATHGVVMDATEGSLWVSEGPHLLGRFVRFDLVRLLDPAHEPRDDEALEVIEADPALGDGTIDAWQHAGMPHAGVE